MSDRTRPNPFPGVPGAKAEPARVSTPHPAERAAGGGFAARLQDATLWDLIQFECMRRSRRIVRVSSRGLLGFVFFRDGDVVHATTGRQTGEAALGEMLGWQEGAFETWSGTWPDRETITNPWQRVLLEVAQAKDEASGEHQQKVLSFPGREPVAVFGAQSEPTPPPFIPPASAGAGPIEAVTLSPAGKVLAGKATSDLAEAAAYAVELADLIGEFLGLDAMRGLEVSFDHAHFFVGRAPDGNVVAARAARPEQLDPLKKGTGQ